VEHHRAEASEADEPLEDAFEFRALWTATMQSKGKCSARLSTGTSHSSGACSTRTLGIFNLPARYPSDPLREMKNLAITGNSILLRAAIKGGLTRALRIICPMPMPFKSSNRKARNLRSE
jgi:hypothetical protein